MNGEAQSAEGFTVGRTLLAGTTVLSPSSSLTFEHCAEMRSALEEACRSRHPRVVIDCRAVKLMDSEALVLLVESHEKLRANRAELRLAHLNDVCSDILTVCRLIHVFVVCDDIHQAIKDG